MKKSLFFYAAATALMLTACSSEDDILQTGPEKKAAPQEVGFDVYTPAATDVTRAGQVGTMTTGRLQRDPLKSGGFGVYAYLVEDADETTGATDYKAWNRTSPAHAPNFMVNQLVDWNATNLGWQYAPLKYWPNETDKDSQSSPAMMQDIPEITKHLDRLTFFAYAPYVATGANEPGITLLTNLKGYLDADPTSSTTTGSLVEPSIGYKASLDDPEKVVDLLWGVAPAGGLTYTAVNGNTVEVPEGNPLIDMTKPDVNTNMKFLFQHALARIGVKVRAAIDQVPAGGELDAKTKITIDEVTLTGKFGETGILNLDNPTANVAHWVKINTNTGTETTISEATEINGNTTLTLSADAGTIAPWLRYKGEHTFGSYSEQTVDGVTTVNQDLITPRYYQLDEVPAYNPTKQYYTKARAEYTVNGTEGFYKLNGNDYEEVASGTITDGTNPNYYTLKADGPHIQKNPAPSVPAGTVFYKREGTTYKFIGTGITWNASGNNTEYWVLTPKAVEPSDIDFKYTNEAVATYTVKATDNIYTKDANGIYKQKEPGSISAPAIGKTNTEYYSLATDKTIEASVNSQPDFITSADTRFYYIENGVYKHFGKVTDWTTDRGRTIYTVTPTVLKSTDEPLKFEYTAPIFDKERNYFMVVPTNNVKTLHTGLAKDKEEALRTIRVKIKYYVTTEDDKIDGGRTQIENVIEKDVLFPSLANGKSYNLNLVLGLTSVKMEAEVDDWKVVNVQADLPQNTAGD